MVQVYCSLQHQKKLKRSKTTVSSEFLKKADNRGVFKNLYCDHFSGHGFKKVVFSVNLASRTCVLRSVE